MNEMGWMDLCRMMIRRDIKRNESPHTTHPPTHSTDTCITQRGGWGNLLPPTHPPTHSALQ